MSQNVDRYLITIRCTHYNKYNTYKPVISGSFVFELQDEFIGEELQAVKHFKSKYTRLCQSKTSTTNFQVEDVYKIVQDGGDK